MHRSIRPHLLAVIAFVAASLHGAAHAQGSGGIPINIESVPPGATVFLDSTDGAPLGTTPLAAVRLSRGPHTLIFRLENYEEARLTITVARRRETFRAVLRALGTIEVSAGNEGARGGTVFVDGAPVGGGTLGSLAVRVPNLPPGRHQVRVEHAGFVAFEQWVEVLGGQTVRVTAMLERVAPDTGSILVDADVRGAPIFLDGRDTGRRTNTVLDDVSVGTHEVEIRPEGGEPFRQTVLVQRGARAEVHATLRAAAPAGGRLTIVVSPVEAASAATVYVDSEPLPSGSRSRSDLEPGTHVVQVTAPGYVAASQTVTVLAGQASTVEIVLVAVRGEPTDINLQASVPGATIVVDGEEHPSPYVADETEGRTHSVVVRAEGFAEVAFTCSTVSGAAADTDCQRTVELEPLMVRLRAETTAPTREPAELYVDDERVSTLPYEGRIAVGSHVFEVRAAGYETYRQQIEVEYDEGDITLSANMVDSSETAAAGATTHSAVPIPLNHPMIDLSLGWPYLGEIRLGIGLHELVDAGFTIRTLGRLTEFEGRARFGVRVLQQLGVGAQVRFGGGIGPSASLRTPGIYPGVPGRPSACSSPGTGPCPNQDYEPAVATGTAFPGYSTGVNNAFFSLEGNVSLLLEPVAAVTLWLGFDFHSDQYYGHPRGESAFLDIGPSGDRICGINMTNDGIVCAQGRQDQFRLRLGGAVEFNIDRNWGVFAIFEGILWQPPDHRRVLSDLVGEGPEVRIYPRLGATYRF
jgi:hypothetical protein